MQIVPFDEAQAKAGATAYDRYGKGIDPKAKLNLADCAAYALAKSLDAPLLFKGRDFAATDVRSALEREGGIGTEPADARERNAYGP